MTPNPNDLQARLKELDRLRRAHIRGLQLAAREIKQVVNEAGGHPSRGPSTGQKAARWPVMAHMGQHPTGEAKRAQRGTERPSCAWRIRSNDHP